MKRKYKKKTVRKISFIPLKIDWNDGVLKRRGLRCARLLLHHLNEARYWVESLYFIAGPERDAMERGIGRIEGKVKATILNRYGYEE